MALTLSVLLAALGIAAFPCWRHSVRWGYLPSTAIGFLLVLIAVLTAGGRTLTDDGRLARLKASQEVMVANAGETADLHKLSPP